MSSTPSRFWAKVDQALPSAEEIDRNVYQAVAFGFPLLTLVIITGAVWAQYVWQRWWSWDPKETASLVTWLVYGAYLHGRRQRNWSPRTSATFALLGFIAVLFTFAGVNLLNSMHAYGAPEASASGRILGGFTGVAAPEVGVTTGFFIAYLLAFLAALASVVGFGKGASRLAVGLAVAAVLGNTVVLGMRTIDAGRLTFTTGYDFSLWFVWGIALCATIVAVVRRGEALPLLGALPLALLVAMYGYLYFPQKDHTPLMPALQNKFWLHMHVAIAIIAYGALALAAGWGLCFQLKALATRRASPPEPETEPETD